MPYPDSALPVVVEIAPGAAPAGDPGDWMWVDVTSSWRVKDGITYSEGRGDWGATVDAGSISLTFDNRSGDFSEFNPSGQWYGLLGKDTPLRVRIRRGEDAFGRTASNGWGTSDSGQAWTTRSGATSNYAVSGGTATHSHGVVNVLRATTLGVSLVDVEQCYDVSVPALITGAAVVTGTLARYIDVDNYYWLGVEFNSGGTSTMLKIRKRVAGTTTELAVLNPVPSLTYAAGVPIRVRALVDGDHLAVKAWTASGNEPAGWMLETTDTSLTAPGAVGLQTWVVSGNTNTLPLAVSFSNYQANVDLAGGYVPAWVPRWDRSRNDRWVPVTARGVLYRLQPATGTPPTRSAMRRYIPYTSPAAYWPVEEGASAGQVASAIPGHAPMAISGVTEFAPPDEATISSGAIINYGTSALANIKGGGRLTGTVPGDVTTATAAAWTASVASQVDVSGAGITTDAILLEVTCAPGGTFASFRLVAVYATTETRVIGVRADGTTATLISDPGVITSFTLHNFSVWQAGGNITAGFNWSATSAAYEATGSTAGTLTGVTGVAANPTGVTSGLNWPVGHIAIWPVQPTPLGNVTDPYGAILLGSLRAWSAETAHLRLARLAAEDNIDIDVPAVTSGLEVRMDWQQPGKPRDLYQQPIDADGGILLERPFRLAYRTRESLYSQTPALTLTSDQLGQEPEPDDTGQGYRNRWEVKRPDGSSAIAQADEVAAGAIVYDDSAEVRVAVDDQLSDQAAWRLHLTSNKDLRWPRVDLDLAGTPELIDAWLCCRPGARVRVTNPPADVAGQDIDLMVEGHSTRLDYKGWDVTINASPGRLWDVATAVDPATPLDPAGTEQRVAADGSTLAADLADGATTLSLASTAANGVWTTDIATDYPLDVRVGGERVRLGVPGQQLVTNPWMAVDSSGWVAAGATIARSTAQTTLGYASLQITPDGTSASGGANGTIVAVTASQTYLAGCWVYTTATTSVGPAVDWWTATSGGSYISTGFVGPTSTTAGTWVWMSGVLTAPGTAAGAVMRARHSGTPPASSIWYATQLVLIPVASYSTSPQTMTIGPGGRGINGVTRAWDAGTPVDVWLPAIAPL